MELWSLGLTSENAVGPKWSQSIGKTDGEDAVMQDVGSELDGGSVAAMSESNRNCKVQKPWGSSLKIMLKIDLPWR